MPAQFPACDPAFPLVAGHVQHLITPELPWADITPFGSAAIPGYGGKWAIDLMLVYPSGNLDPTRMALDRMGCQKTGTFPRVSGSPVRIGSIDYHDKRYRIHTHAIEQGQAEIQRQLVFRVRLRSDASIVRKSKSQKHRILAQGITVGPGYAIAKSDFIQRHSSSKNGTSLTADTVRTLSSGDVVV